MLTFYDSEIVHTELICYVKLFLSLPISNVLYAIDEIQLPNHSLNFSKIKSIADLIHKFFKRLVINSLLASYSVTVFFYPLVHKRGLGSLSWSL